MIGNEDKEGLEFKDLAGIGEEEEAMRDVKWFHDPKQNNKYKNKHSIYRQKQILFK